MVITVIILIGLKEGKLQLLRNKNVFTQDNLFNKRYPIIARKNFLASF